MALQNRRRDRAQTRCMRLFEGRANPLPLPADAVETGLRTSRDSDFADAGKRKLGGGNDSSAELVP